MIRFQATYFDGQTSKAQAVVVGYDGQHLSLHSADGNIQLRYFLKECVITPASGHAPRIIKLPDNQQFESGDLNAVAALEVEAGGNRGMRAVHWLESHWKPVAGCLAGAMLCVWAFIVHAIPFLAEKAADAIPPEITRTVSHKTLSVLDKRFFEPSELSAEKKTDIQNLFQTIADALQVDFQYQLAFRRSPQIGPNAFALPAGIIVITDEIVELAANERELASILAHEIAHVEKRHGLRSMLQHAGVFFVVSVLAGDITSITSTAGTLPTILVESGYSRRFETEADEFAGRFLIGQGWGTQPLQDMLQRLAASHPDFPSLTWLSSHPDIQQRIENLRKLEHSHIP
ncbi:MAG: M48 family metallopeptidase [Desulfobacterales bacterium]|nr:M48 family metallopeptidase [Desulfobacterales bacterium]